MTEILLPFYFYIIIICIIYFTRITKNTGKTTNYDDDDDEERSAMVSLYGFVQNNGDKRCLCIFTVFQRYSFSIRSAACFPYTYIILII